MFQIYHDNVASVAVGTAKTGLVLYVFGRLLGIVSSGPDRSPPPCEPAGIFELLNNLYRIPSDLCVYKIICMVRKTLALYVSYFIEMFKVTTGLVLHVALYFHGLFSTNSGSDRSPPRKPDGVLEIPKTFSRIPSINSMAMAVQSYYEIIRSLSACKIMCMFIPALWLYVMSYFIMKLGMEIAVMLHSTLYFLMKTLRVIMLCMAKTTLVLYRIVDFYGLSSTNSGSDHSPPREPDGVVEIPIAFSRIPSINSMVMLVQSYHDEFLPQIAQILSAYKIMYMVKTTLWLYATSFLIMLWMVATAWVMYVTSYFVTVCMVASFVVKYSLWSSKLHEPLDFRLIDSKYN